MRAGNSQSRQTDGAHSQDKRQWQRLEMASWLSIAVHGVAASCMAFVLAPGLDVNSDMQARCTFIASNRLIWTCGWFTWNLAAISILNFFVSFCSANKHSAQSVHLLKLGLCLGTAAIAADLCAESIE